MNWRTIIDETLAAIGFVAMLVVIILL